MYYDIIYKNIKYFIKEIYMNVLGIIAEYNPFHYGHKYHLEKSLKDTNCDHSVVVMSGSFVQRGTPSFVDKWTKAKMAIDNGVDLVIELPTIYSSQSAELFALGAIKVLNSIKLVEFLSFGSEEGHLEPLEKISELLSDEPVDFKNILNHYLSLGNSFPVSRSLALEDYFKIYKSSQQPDIKNILKESNNILAIEYLKAINSTRSDIKPYTIKRIGSAYKDRSINTKYSSATAIRDIILKADLHKSKELVPIETFKILEKYIEKYKIFNQLDNYKDIIRYLLLTKDKDQLNNIIDISEGLENRIVKLSKKNNNMEDIISDSSTKRYPQTRIQRILTHLLLDLNRLEIEKAYLSEPTYIRILGANRKGQAIIRKIKKEASIKVITKFSDYRKYNIKELQENLEFEKKVTDIYFLGLSLKTPLVDMDYYTSPYMID